MTQGKLFSWRERRISFYLPRILFSPVCAAKGSPNPAPRDNELKPETMWETKCFLKIFLNYKKSAEFLRFSSLIPLIQFGTHGTVVFNIFWKNICSIYGAFPSVSKHTLPPHSLIRRRRRTKPRREDGMCCCCFGVASSSF